MDSKNTPTLRFSADRPNKISHSADRLSNVSSGKTLLTPCRRMGLKRKSLSTSKHNLFKDTNLSNSPKSESDTGIEMKETCKKRLVNEDTHCKTSENNSLETKRNHFVSNTFVNKLSSTFSSPRSLQVNKSPVKDENISPSCNEPKINIYKDKPEVVTLDVLESLADIIKQKKEKLQHSELCEIYEKKHDLDTLKQLCLEWKKGCQEALCDLQSLFREKGQSFSMLNILAQFQIPHNIIGFDEDTDDFE